jgi:putative transposase
MPRRPRLQIVDGMYHLGTRGNRRCTIFHDDDDRVSFLQMLERTVKRAEWICHAWCLMGTHYHLLIETPAETLSSGMEFLNGRYARSFNEKYGLRGPPIREAVLRRADRGRHAARRDGRYIVRNPLRAGICERAAEWPWSSFNAKAGTTEAPAFLNGDTVLKMFGRSPDYARRRYVDCVETCPRGTRPVPGTGHGSLGHGRHPTPPLHAQP